MGSRARKRGRLGAAVLALALAACQTTPVTGRSSFNLFTTGDDIQIGRQAYQDVLSEARQVTSGPELAMVRRIMERIAAVADDPGYEWEVALIDDPATVNAFALPGGKMAVYTGILPVCGDETGLAVVMGHEIGHVVAQHGTQRMTRSMGIDLVFGLLDAGDYETLARSAVQLGFEMPYGRSEESEADHIGLVYMARAGYDPRAAPRLWERMGALGGSQPPEFLSTHPSHETRIQNLRSWMPEALRAFEAAGGDVDGGAGGPGGSP